MFGEGARYLPAHDGGDDTCEEDSGHDDALAGRHALGKPLLGSNRLTRPSPCCTARRRVCDKVQVLGERSCPASP